MRRLLLLPLLLLALPDPRPAASASFDCAKAASDSEKAICANPGLSELDEAVANAYGGLRENFATLGEGPQDAAVTALTATQRGWVADRNTCRADVSCLTHQHERRLAVLSAKPDPDARSPVDALLGLYEAGDGDAENYSATLIKGDDASALVLLDGASQNWTCSFTGIGKLDAKGEFVVARPADPATSVRIARTGDGLAIADADDHVSAGNCGRGGSFAQSYRRAP